LELAAKEQQGPEQQGHQWGQELQQGQQQQRQKEGQGRGLEQQ